MYLETSPEMPRTKKLGRAKISTTIDSRNFAYLEAKVSRGEAANMADALDRSLRAIRRLENRQRLAAATSAYFQDLKPEEIGDENGLARDLSSNASRIDFDQEL